ncbi:MAG: helix-turn-helix transcriptional regulator [Pseudonocardiales bacterium]|nr:helix-turn-helix transcriptional regulator [Pseudonocardiales bacterium]
MPAGPELAAPNPFAAELRRAIAAAAAPDKTLSLRELSDISGVGRSAIGDWLNGKSLPRSWDNGAVLVVDAIIRLADRYGKRFADEEAVRQRCKDAYGTARSAQQANNTSGTSARVPGIDATTPPAEAAADDGPEPAQSDSQTPSARWWRAKRTVLAVAMCAVLTVAVALILLLHPTRGCLDKSSITSWEVSEVHVCASNGRGRYSGSIHTTDKAADSSCVRWRIVWDNKPDTYTPQACPQKHENTKFDSDPPAGVSGVRDAFLERVPPGYGGNLPPGA